MKNLTLAKIAAFFRLLASIADAIAEAIEPIPPTPEDKDA